MPRFKLWYPMGAGGMWLNYLIWCGQNHTVIHGKHTHFEFPYLQTLDPDYECVVEFSRHSNDFSHGDVRLGSHRAWLNFFANIIDKKGHWPNWEQEGPACYFTWHDQSVDFNLDWCDIFENPAQFIDVLNSLTGLGLQLDYYVTTAITQYKQSCAEPGPVIIKAWKDYIFHHRTSTQDHANLRQQQADNEFASTYYLMKK